MSQHHLYPNRARTHERRLARLEADVVNMRGFLARAGVDVDEMIILDSPGVRNLMPSTYAEWAMCCRLLAEECADVDE